MSYVPGSATDRTWTAVLPADGSFLGCSHGPAFWFRWTVTVHFYITAAKDGWARHGARYHGGRKRHDRAQQQEQRPLMPSFDTQAIGNALGWGIVSDTPNSFVWEIGQTSPFTSTAPAFCVPGEVGCYSYDTAAWQGTLPIVISSVTFADGSHPQHWAVVSDYGDKAEVKQ